MIPYCEIVATYVHPHWKLCGNKAAFVMNRKIKVCTEHRKSLDYPRFGLHGGITKPAFSQLQLELF